MKQRIGGILRAGAFGLAGGLIGLGVGLIVEEILKHGGK